MIGLVFWACHKPVPLESVHATEEGLSQCPLTEITQWRAQWRADLSRPAEQAIRRGYEHAVARWAVCVGLSGVSRWDVPRLQDEDARALVAAAHTPRGSVERREAVLALDAVWDAEAALFLVDELAVFEEIGAMDPSHRAPAAEALRPWVGGDGGLEGLMFTLALSAAPAVEAQGPLFDALEEWIDDRWTAVEAVEFPRRVQVDIAVPVGPGDSVPEGALAVGLPASGPAWMERAYGRLTRFGWVAGERTAFDPAAVGRTTVDLWVCADRPWRDVWEVASVVPQGRFMLAGAVPAGVVVRPGGAGIAWGEVVRAPGSAPVAGGVLAVFVPADAPFGPWLEEARGLGLPVEVAVVGLGD